MTGTTPPQSWQRAVGAVAGRQVVDRRGILAVALLAAGLVAQAFAGPAIDALLLRLPGADKVLHSAGFFVAFLLLHVSARGWQTSGAARVVATFVVGAGLGIVVEIVQGMVPHRSVELADVAADLFGLSLGAAFVLRSKRLGRALAIASVTGSALVTAHSYFRTRDYLHGVRAEARREYAVARRHYLAAFEKGLRTASLYNGLGWVEIESGEGNAAQAVEYARTALTMRPGDPDILDTYGWALLHTGNVSEALPHLLEAFAKKPRMYCIHYHLGEAYRRLGRLGEARQQFELQLIRTPQGPDAALAQRALALIADKSSK